jgi:hypothetical protein
MQLQIGIALAVLADLSLLVLALVLMTQPACRSKSCLLLVYALTTGLNNDYVVTIKAFDRALGRDGALVHSITLAPVINFALDLSGRIALLIVIWLVLVYLIKETLATRAAR